jgi:hypothetical protein
MFGGGYASGMPDKKRHAEFFFEAFDLLAKRRLGDAQYLCCTRKIAGFGDLNEVLELAQIHLGPCLDISIPVSVHSKYAFVKTIASNRKLSCSFSRMQVTQLHHRKAAQSFI